MQFRDLGLGFKVGGLGFKLGRFTGNPAYDGTPALLEHRPPDHSACCSMPRLDHSAPAACPGSGNISKNSQPGLWLPGSTWPMRRFQLLLS